MNTKTLNQLNEELNKLVSEGLGEREVYLFNYDHEDKKRTYEPFNYELIKPTILDEAITGKDLLINKHLVFQRKLSA